MMMNISNILGLWPKLQLSEGLMSSNFAVAGRASRKRMNALVLYRRAACLSIEEQNIPLPSLPVTAPPPRICKMVPVGWGLQKRGCHQNGILLWVLQTLFLSSLKPWPHEQVIPLTQLSSFPISSPIAGILKPQLFWIGIIAASIPNNTETVN